MAAVAADADYEQRLQALEEALAARDKVIAKLEGVAAEHSKQIDTMRSSSKESKGSSGYETSEIATQNSRNLETRAFFWSADLVRSTFIKFFQQKHEHTFWASSPILPSTEDQTLLFVNSGMVQYKPIFVGRIPKNSPFEGLRRAVNSQKCVRAGGKHNDLEDVGRDNYHHTYFEMLGNWSFGDYFKAEAIAWAWEMLTVVFGLPGERLYATYFEGYTDPKTGMTVPADTEARDLWMQFLPESHVLPGNMKDNFWEMGDTGPCGPCSELHFDRIGGRNARDLVNMDDPNVLEIWNLVFMQHFRHEDRSLTPLPDKHVDTGMGFERLVSVLQNKTSNYDTDVFAPLFQAILDLRLAERGEQKDGGAGPQPYQGRMGDDDADGVDTAYRVIVDHIRTLTFSITDRITPGAAGRGYVLRRILRRGVRFGKQFLNLPDGFFAKLVDVVCDTYGGAFPELVAEGNRERVRGIISSEEASFLKTWGRGEKAFNKIVEKLKAAGKSTIPGEDAAYLYQTGGFPIDLTRIMAEDQGMTVDEAGFEAAQAKHRDASKGEAKNDGSVTIVLEAAETKHLSDAGVEATDDSHKYDLVASASKTSVVKAIFNGSEFVEQAETGSVVGVVLDLTSFYAEQGGQVSDIGKIVADSGLVFEVQDCRKYGPFVLHQGTVREGTLTTGQVQCQVDEEYRRLVLPNHTMTHVLNLALRRVIGATVDQKGSLNNAEKLRFDFNCDGKIAADKLEQIEAIVREQIAQRLPIFTKVVPLASAMEISTLRAVFGETYPDPVRVVSVGKDIETLLSDPTNPEWQAFSVELCGGTHLSNTADAVAFVLAEESGVAKGIRRVVCLTGAQAQAAIQNGEAFHARLESAFDLAYLEMDAESRQIASALDTLVCSAHLKIGFESRLKALVKQVVKKRAAAAKEACGALQGELEGGSRFLVRRIDGLGGKLAKKQLTSITKKVPGACVAVFDCDEAKGKVAMYAAIGKEMSAIEANAWCMHAIAVANGKGGGKKNYAQATGSAEHIAAAMQAAEEYASKALA